jgi:hypothetical protein
MQYKIFNISETPSHLTFRRVLFPRYLWIIVVFGLIFLFLTILGMFAIRFGIFSVGMGIGFCLTFSLVLVYLIWWINFSEYPVTIQMSHENIAIQFRRFFKSSKIVEIKSQNQPRLMADCFHHYTGFMQHSYYARVSVESTVNHSIVIYLHLQSSEKQALQYATQLANRISIKTGFLFRDQINKVAG